MLDENRLLEIFLNYLSNDYDATGGEYVLEALTQAGAEMKDIEDLGFGFLLDLV